MSHLNISLIHIFIISPAIQIDQDFIQMHKAFLLVAVSGRFIGNTYQTAFLQLLYMACQGSIADVQSA